jgi:hypothetical protein
MAAVLKRLGLRLRTVVKAKPQKKIAETEASGANIEKKPREQRPRPASPVGGALVKRPVLWVKSPAGRSPGVCSRLGLAGTVHAGGMVDADSAQLHSTFGSSAKPSDCLVDALEAWGAALETAKQVAMTRLQSKRDNGPARRRGIRTQVRHRMVQFADQIGQPIHRLYAPP